ncbi:LacI family transcriptional regulator [candidate division KSB3 bacterium]|uniref:LacI family transcriptional regulator n=1 Tax=candidate division KSB3 bacterium TaxID=2044937 RepID=A0A2G6KCV1_9BACT|nr:MAG: LacI family transcriptional regulator [candidate division KSB3 bacterium]
MAVTLKDIAKRAGVSATTVSLVLNQGSNSRISEATRDKILHIVKELGYQTNKTPQPLPLTIPPTIGLVFTDITNPFFTTIAAVIENVASRYGYNIILCNTQKNIKKEKEYLDVLSRRRVDGLIIAPVDDQKSDLADFVKRETPLVFIDRCPAGMKSVNAILLNNVEGAYLATKYLLDLGHRRIGFIRGRKNVMTGKERLQGYYRALHEYDIPIDEQLICDGLFTTEGGQNATNTLLDLSSPPSALFSSGGVMSVGALIEIKQRGLVMPRDLSFISFDDEKWCLLTDPPLTVIAQPVNEIGTEAAQLVIQLIQGWGTETSQKIILKPTLFERGSCAQYPAIKN